MSNEKIKVLIVDDSVTMQRYIKQLLIDDPVIEIVAAASDPYEARDLIKQYNPDVLILDIEMPKMDGLTFLANIMRLRPMPVIMNSSLSQTGAYETIKALELGAADYIGKPQSSEDVANYKVLLVNKLKRVAKIKVNGLHTLAEPSQKVEKSAKLDESPVKKIIAIGASTGGIEALSVLLREIPAIAPPILIVQHIPPNFSQALAYRFNETCSIRVMEAVDGQKLHNGCAYIASGGKQMLLSVKGEEYFTSLQDSPLVSGHKPSVDALFLSIAQYKNLKCSAAILTGMGNDGAIGLQSLYANGVQTVVQDEESSVVWGMPKSAKDLEPRHKVLPLKDIAKFLIN